MAMDVVTAALNAATEGLKLLNTPLAEKLIKKKAEIQQEILDAESEAWGLQDDVRITYLYKQAKIWFEAAGDAIKLAVTTEKR